MCCWPGQRCSWAVLMCCWAGQRHSTCPLTFFVRIPKDTYYDHHQEETDFGQDKALKDKPKSGECT